MQSLRKYISSLPSLNPSAIAKQMGVGQSYLHQCLNPQSGKELTPARTWQLIAILCENGYRVELGGWEFRYDPTDDTFTLEKRLEKEAESIEHTDENGAIWYEYLVPMSRAIISDEAELLAFFKS